MKKRHFLTLLGIILIIWGAAVYHAWQLWDINNKLRDSIQAKISEVLGAPVSIEKVVIRPSRIHLRDLRFQPADSSYMFWVDDVSLGFSLQSLIKGRLNPEQIGEDIIINRPRLTVYLRKTRAAADSADAIDIPTHLPDGYNSALLSTSFLHNLTVSNGELYLYNDSTRVSTRLLDGMNGWFGIRKNGKAIAKLSANVFGSRDGNVSLSGSVNFVTNRIDSILFNVHDLPLNQKIPFLSPPYLSIDSGTLNGRVVLQPDPLGTGYMLHGSAALRNGKLRIPRAGLDYENINLDLAIRNDLLTIRRGSFLLNNSPAAISGEVRDFFSPQLDLTLESRRIDFQEFFGQINTKTPLPIVGTGKLLVSLKESIFNPIFTASLYSDSLFVGTHVFRSVHADMQFKDYLLTVQHLTAQNGASKLWGQGHLSFSTPGNQISLSLFSEGDLFRTLNPGAFGKLPKSQGKIAVEIRGPLQAPRASGVFDLTVSSEPSRKMTFLGNFDITSWDLSLSAEAANGSMFIDGQVTDLFTDPYVQIKSRNLAAISAVFELPGLEMLNKRYRLDAALRGRSRSLNLELTATSRKSQRREFACTFDLAKSDADISQLQGFIQFYPDSKYTFSSRFSATLTDSAFIVTSLGNEHWLSGRLSVQRKGERRIDGLVKISGPDIGQMLGANDADASAYKGKLFAEARMSGSIDNPVVEWEGWLLDGFFRGEGVYTAEMAGRVSPAGLDLSKFEINFAGEPYFSATGNIKFAPFLVDIQLDGSNIDPNALIYAMIGKDDILGGRADVHVTLRGNRWPVDAYGKIRIRDGNVLWFRFDELIFDLGDMAQGGNGSYLDGEVLHIGNISYMREGDFVLHGAGDIPFNEEDSVDIRLRGTGNILAILPDVSSVMTSAGSAAKLALRLTGPYGTLRLSDSRLRILNGQLQLSMLAKEITDISGDIVADGDFIHIKNLSGRVDGSMIAIDNAEDGTVYSGFADTPLRLNYDWMSLGTLRIRSGEQGLPLNIPGIMESGEVGRFVIRGRGDEPGFLISGPWKHPKFRGEVALNGANVTFPFEENSDEVDPLVSNILMNIDWDLLVIAGEGNHYIKKVPSGLDHVYVNLGIDAQVSQLLFTGIFRDTSSVDLALLPTANSAESFLDSSVFAAGTDAANRDSSAKGAYYLSLQKQNARTTIGPDTSTFRIEGVLESTRGNIEYLDLNFRVEKFGAIWDRSELDPIVYGRAWTAVADSANFPHNVYLSLYSKDPLTGDERSHGKWEEAYFRLESETPGLISSQANVLADLGYSASNIKQKATDAIGISADNMLFRPLFRPVERTIERSLGLDMVQFSSRFTRNFLEMNLANGSQFENTMALLRHTKLTVGKYLTSRMFLLYSGQIDTWPGVNKFNQTDIGLRHTFGLEYRFTRDLLLQMEYDYNSLFQTQKDDKRIWLRHSFSIKQD